MTGSKDPLTAVFLRKTPVVPKLTLLLASLTADWQRTIPISAYRTAAILRMTPAVCKKRRAEKRGHGSVDLQEAHFLLKPGFHGDLPLLATCHHALPRVMKET